MYNLNYYRGQGHSSNLISNVVNSAKFENEHCLGFGCMRCMVIPLSCHSIQISTELPHYEGMSSKIICSWSCLNRLRKYVKIALGCAIHCHLDSAYNAVLYRGEFLSTVTG